jgi:chemotaxis protein methyltransferase CheR
VIVLDQKAFSTIAGIARAEAGLNIADTKIGMVHARLQRRLRKLGLKDYNDYCALLMDPKTEGTQERRYLVEALTTNVTHFFREAHHFPLVEQEFEQSISSRADRPFRVWSAGCSNGSETVSLCLTLASSRESVDPNEFYILGTDIDSTALSVATHGSYALEVLGDNRWQKNKRYLQMDGENTFKLKEIWKRRVNYVQASLLEHPVDTEYFDAVFCRNVTIYFDKKTCGLVQGHLLSVLKPGGLLCLGHSERLVDPFHERQCTRIGPTAYRKQSESVYECR